jgi:hypothetical protein
MDVGSLSLKPFISTMQWFTTFWSVAHIAFLIFVLLLFPRSVSVWSVSIEKT